MSKILIIEDDPQMSRNIEEILLLSNYQTLTANDGYSGLQLAQEHSPDIILCDIMMPKVDGYDVLISLRQNAKNPNIPFIFLTGKGDRSDLRQGMEFGADDYLSKPFTPGELLQAIKTQLEKKSTFHKYTQTQLNNLRNNISRAIPHEMNTALNGIMGFSELLMQEESLSPVGLEMSQIIYKSAKQLHHLVKNYLLYVELELSASEQEQPEARRVKKSTNCTQGLVVDIAVQIANKFHRGEDLSIEVQNATLKISTDRLIKILEEIIDNAFKFSAPKTAVKIVGTREDSLFNLVVINYGRGMKPEHINHLGAFMQFERDIYEQQGSGLGLALTKRIVELCDGQLNIESIQDDHTTVRLSLPILKC